MKQRLNYYGKLQNAADSFVAKVLKCKHHEVLNKHICISSNVRLATIRLFS